MSDSSTHGSQELDITTEWVAPAREGAMMRASGAADLAPELETDLEADLGPDSLPDRVISALAATTQSDGISPLDEQGRFALRDWATTHVSSASNEVEASSGATLHVTARSRAGEVAGYLQARSGSNHVVVELFVCPGWRRKGVATQMVDVGVQALRAMERTVSVLAWSHSAHAAAPKVAQRVDMAANRTLFRMRRASEQPLDFPLPEGFGAASLADFRGQEREDIVARVLAVNAAAFAAHPEQGDLDRAGFEQRTRESWHADAGLILVFDSSEQPTGRTLKADDAASEMNRARLAAIHWVKHLPGSTDGEVYVVAVDPSVQGRGLAKPLTALGVDLLLEAGCHAVDLYVDENNVRAVATYAGLGFEIVERHTQYSQVAQLSDSV